MYRERRFFAPIKEGEELNVRIEATGEKGDGIARVKGFVIFIPNTKEGDELKIRVTKVLRKVAFGEVIGKESKKKEKRETKEEKEEEKENIEYNFEE